jgi:hypothetical protein
VWLCTGVSLQAHTRLVCSTQARSGELQVTTVAGSASTAFDVAVLLQPPIITAVFPTVWSTEEETVVTVTGDRCVGAPELCWDQDPLLRPDPSGAHATTRRTNTATRGRFGCLCCALAAAVSRMGACMCCCLRRFGPFPSLLVPVRANAGGTACPSRSTDFTCALADGTVASGSRFSCVMPPGVGAGFSFFLRNIWTAAPAAAGYQPPTVTAVAPAVLPVMGGEVVITGRNFGLCVPAPTPVEGPASSGVALQVQQVLEQHLLWPDPLVPAAQGLGLR